MAAAAAGPGGRPVRLHGHDHVGHAGDGPGAVDSLIHATDAVILGFGRAAPLADRDVTATLRYAGVPDALTLTLNADRTAGSLRYNLTRGPTDTFSADASYTHPARVIDDQVYSDLTDPHNRTVREPAAGHQPPELHHAPLDGNPSAATAFLADQTFRKYALVRDDEPGGYGGGPAVGRYADGAARAVYSPVYWFDAMGQAVQTNGFDGSDVRFSFNAAGRFAPYVGWSLSVPVQYRQVNGAESDTVGVEFGVPVEFVTPGRRQPFGWTVTPFAEFAVSDSRDLGTTQAVFDGGVASRLTYRFGRQNRWTVALGDQFTGFVGLGRDPRRRRRVRRRRRLLRRRRRRRRRRLPRPRRPAAVQERRPAHPPLRLRPLGQPERHLQHVRRQRRHRPVVDPAAGRRLAVLAQPRPPAGVPGRLGQPLPEPGRRLPDRLPVLNGAGAGRPGL